MSTYGVTSTGFVKPSLTDIQADLEAAYKAKYGQSIDVSPQSVFGQHIGIQAERLADLWDGLQSVYTAFFPDGATAVALDYVCGLTGTRRADATHSTVTAVCVGTNGTALTAGRVAQVAGTLTRWLSQGTATIVTLSAWSAAATIAKGALRSKGGNIYYATQGGVTAGSGGPTGTGTAIADNTVIWRYIAAGSAAVAATFQAEDTGPIVAAAGDLNIIATPVAGWISIVNPVAETTGADVDTDPVLRVRREAEIARGGSATVEAIRAHVRELAGVLSCFVFENVTDATDGNGLPPHSFEVLVGTGAGFTLADLLSAIWTNKPAGIRSYGSSSGTVTDSQGNSQTVSYSTPTERDIYVVLNVTCDASTFNASSGPTDLIAALLTYGLGAYVMGKDVVANALVAQAFKVSGVLDATAYIGTSPSPVSSATIAVGLREFAALDAARITVNVSYGTP
jgi:uncharacterized phage protein gp47/JayE